MATHHTTLCAATRVGGGHWSVGGCWPSISDRDLDEYTARLHWTAPDGTYRIHTALRLTGPAGDEQVREQMRQKMHLLGYLSVFYKRAHETPARTNQRRRGTAKHRQEMGWPTSPPNDATRRK